MKEFFVHIKKDYNMHKLKVRCIYEDKRIEQFEVCSKKQSLVVESNRPFFRNKGLKHRRPDWKYISGPSGIHLGSLDVLYSAILAVLEPPLKPH